MDASPGPCHQAPGCQPTAASELFNTLYAELSRLARREVRRSGGQHLVGTGTLVHEAWLDIHQRRSLAFDGPGRFLAYAARTMRGLMVDQLRASRAMKRGGDVVITALDTHHQDEVMRPESMEPLSEAIDALAALEADLADVVDLRFFCGFTLAEIATMKQVSERTVQRQWEKARLLLQLALG
ncbi:ECF-type sigma factor [Pelomonas cellulosilytica]|uniref:Sigma-70 family RNA polymerase sigma factor n=1 Tax=Pelomonas cellulosilytica TaxID=2906762 RepID=A0ABS8XW30_9BURK|nr:ECF-type sigma factor [Pelomonas sp. P8]MCE4555423.1 sigma-70 family RNA polymerase sigma factor [Pelomonas sp. P8]